MEFKNIEWDLGVKGYLDESEKKNVEAIDSCCETLKKHGKQIVVVIRIDGGNEFDIYNDKCQRIMYSMTAEQCKYAVYGIYAAIFRM